MLGSLTTGSGDKSGGGAVPGQAFAKSIAMRQRASTLPRPADRPVDRRSANPVNIPQ